jgi:hypothetical protein
MGLMIVLAGEEGHGSSGFVFLQQPGAEPEEGAGDQQAALAAFLDPPDGGGVVRAIEHGGKESHFWKGKSELLASSNWLMEMSPPGLEKERRHPALNGDHQWHYR